MQPIKCHICERQSLFIGRAQMLYKYDVAYFRCSSCGFTQTEEPYWLDEAYSAAITSSDLGLLSRSIAMARVAKAVISVFFDQKAKFVDFGAGYGIFVRLMRDRGYDFYWQDPFCENLFAKGFEAQQQRGQTFSLLTAFEVFEHLTDPLGEVQKMLQYAPNILFSTTLLPQHKPLPGEWWYYGTEHGQHLGIYTSTSLRCLADRLGLRFYSNGVSLHLFTRKPLPEPLVRLVLSPRIAMLVSLLQRRPSLLQKDYARLVGRKLG